MYTQFFDNKEVPSVRTFPNRDAIQQMSRLSITDSPVGKSDYYHNQSITEAQTHEKHKKQKKAFSVRDNESIMLLIALFILYDDFTDESISEISVLLMLLFLNDD